MHFKHHNSERRTDHAGLKSQQTETNQLVDSLEMASVKILNAVTERQLKTSGA